MDYELIYYIHSDAYSYSELHLKRFLLWIADHASDKKYLLMSNIDPGAISPLLPSGKEFLFHIVDQSGAQPLNTVARYDRFIKNTKFMSTLFKNESIHWYDLVFPDRCLLFFHHVDGSAFISNLFSKFNISKVHLVGSGTFISNIACDIINYTKNRNNIPLFGYPYGNLTGRYSPFWINDSDKIIIPPLHSSNLFHFLSTKSHKLFDVYNLPKYCIPSEDLSQKIIVELSIHSPRHDILACLRQLLKIYSPDMILIHIYAGDSFADFWRKYIARFSLPDLAIGNFSHKLFSAKAIYTFFPFSAYYLADNFDSQLTINVVDFNRRYSALDGLQFKNAEILFSPEEIKATL